MNSVPLKPSMATCDKMASNDASMPQWLLLDLGAVYDITRTEVVFKRTAFLSVHPEYSADGDTWEKYAERTDFLMIEYRTTLYRPKPSKSKVFPPAVTAAQPGFHREKPVS